MADEATDIQEEETEITEFDSAFEEFATEKDDEPAKAAGSQDTTSEAGAGDAGSTTDAAPEGRAEEVSADGSPDKGADAGDGTPVGDEDPFKGWPQEAIDRFKEQEAKTAQLQHRINSDDGRVRAYQLKVDDLSSKLETVKPDEKPDDKTIADAMQTEEKWNAFKEDYPEFAEIMDARQKQLNQRMDEITETLTPVVKKVQIDTEREALAETNELYAEVAKSYPTWQAETLKPEFHEWMSTQTPGIHALAGSDAPADATLLMDKYDEFRVENKLPSLKTSDLAPGDKPAPADVDKAADEVAKRRERQLQAGTTLPSKNARIDTSAEYEGEFEASFDAFAKLKEAKNRA